TASLQTSLTTLFRNCQGLYSTLALPEGRTIREPASVRCRTVPFACAAASHSSVVKVLCFASAPVAHCSHRRPFLWRPFELTIALLRCQEAFSTLFKVAIDFYRWHLSPR